MKKGITINQPKEEDLYDWSGAQLNPELRHHLRLNNIVRIQVHQIEEGYREAIYVQITGIDGEDLIGTVLDTYRSFFEGEIIYIENGESIRFQRSCVMEIPLDWENDNLKSIATRTGNKRFVTGILPPSENS